jgi:hypothetical protein
MNYKLLFAVAAFLSAASMQPLFSAELSALVGADRAANLKVSSAPVTRAQLKSPVPRLLPQHGELRRLVNEIQSDLAPNIMVETLYLYRKPGSPQGSAPQSGGTEWNPRLQTGLFNQLAALSTLAGIEYYSESRKTMRTFYETSRVVDGPAGKNPQPDPVFTTLPGTLTLYARQKDLTFGDNIYRYDYYTAADSIFFAQENLTAMNAGVIPAIGKNKFRTVIAVIDVGDSLLIYAAAMAKTVSVPGMGDRVGASFSNRVAAVIQWFSAQAKKVF